MIRQFVFCEIEQTWITKQGAPRPKRAFLRARMEKTYVLSSLHFIVVFCTCILYLCFILVYSFVFCTSALKMNIVFEHRLRDIYKIFTRFICTRYIRVYLYEESTEDAALIWFGWDKEQKAVGQDRNRTEKAWIESCEETRNKFG